MPSKTPEHVLEIIEECKKTQSKTIDLSRLYFLLTDLYTPPIVWGYMQHHLSLSQRSSIHMPLLIFY